MPADLTVQVRGGDLMRAMLAEARGQLPYAMMIGLNRTAEDMLTVIRRHVGTTFTIRAPQMLPPQILPREWRATKQKLTARVGLGEGGQKKLGERRRAILEPFEIGKPKTISRVGPVAIPTSYLRPNQRSLIPPRLYPKNLVGRFDDKGDFQGLGTTARIATRTQKRLGTKKGRQVGRYFVLGGANDRFWGLYERTSARGLRRLWTFRNIGRRPPVLRFYAEGESAWEARWAVNFGGALNVALRSAK